jgi:EmrB/QacA subfamily drug resistance transporter
MAALLIAGFMNLIDITIVNVALPSMQSAFGATDSQIEWVVAVYIMTFALLLLPAGRLGDVYGRRLMFISGVVVFTIGSTLCGMAPSIEGLIAARVLQGIGGAMMTPQTLAIVPVLFQPKERGLAFALFGLSAGLASVTGPVLGGLLIGMDLWGMDWRPIFLVNVPVGVIAVIAALRYVPVIPGGEGLRLDYVGVFLAALTLLLLLFPLIEGRQLGWPIWCFAMVVAALPALLAFLAWERRQAATGGAQLLPVELMGNGDYMYGSLLTGLIFMGMPGLFLTLALMFQVGNGLTPLQSGLTTMPFSVGVLIASLASGRLGIRFPRQRISVGAFMMGVGMILLRFAVPGPGETLVQTAFILPLVVAGLGLGTAISPLFQTVLANVAGRDTGSASGALQSFQQVGGAIGLAIVGEIFFSTLRGALPDAVDPAAAYSQAVLMALLFLPVPFLALSAMVWRLPEPELSGHQQSVVVD